jgi:hypothetical protein
MRAQRRLKLQRVGLHEVTDGLADSDLSPMMEGEFL